MAPCDGLWSGLTCIRYLDSSRIEKTNTSGFSVGVVQVQSGLLVSTSNVFTDNVLPQHSLFTVSTAGTLQSSGDMFCNNIILSGSFFNLQGGFTVDISGAEVFNNTVFAGFVATKFDGYSSSAVTLSNTIISSVHGLQGPLLNISSPATLYIRNCTLQHNYTAYLAFSTLTVLQSVVGTVVAASSDLFIAGSSMLARSILSTSAGTAILQGSVLPTSFQVSLVNSSLRLYSNMIPPQVLFSCFGTSAIAVAGQRPPSISSNCSVQAVGMPNVTVPGTYSFCVGGGEVLEVALGGYPVGVSGVTLGVVSGGVLIEGGGKDGGTVSRVFLRVPFERGSVRFISGGGGSVCAVVEAAGVPPFPVAATSSLQLLSSSVAFFGPSFVSVCCGGVGCWGVLGGVGGCWGCWGGGGDVVYVRCLTFAAVDGVGAAGAS
jgi:hypothetical protein